MEFEFYFHLSKVESWVVLRAGFHLAYAFSLIVLILGVNFPCNPLSLSLLRCSCLSVPRYSVSPPAPSNSFWTNAKIWKSKTESRNPYVWTWRGRFWNRGSQISRQKNIRGLLEEFQHEQGQGSGHPGGKSQQQSSRCLCRVCCWFWSVPSAPCH